MKQKYSGIGQAYIIDVAQSQGQATDVEWHFIDNKPIGPQLGANFVHTCIEAADEALLWKAYRNMGETESIFRTLNSVINTKGEKILLKTSTRPQMKASEIYQTMKYKPMPFHRKKNHTKYWPS